MVISQTIKTGDILSKTLLDKTSKTDNNKTYLVNLDNPFRTEDLMGFFMF